MDNQNKKNFYELCEIIEKLRAPDGCPWDREQTHRTLSKHLLEEVYEAFDAIEEGDSQKIADELGDVLLQIVMHAQIGKEEGTFDINDVTDVVSRKMIERHPHVFGEVKAETSDEVLDNWEEIKKQQRGQKSVHEAMEGVTRSLPALYRCGKIIDKAAKAQLFEFKNEKKSIDEAAIGEMLFDVCALARQNGIDAELALSSYTKNFIKKIKNIEENT